MKSKIKKILYNLFSKLSIKENLITFETFRGKNFSCNCKAIYDEMKRQNLDYKYKIFVNKNVVLDSNYKKDIIYKGSIKWIYYTAVSQYWIKNTGAYGGLPKREEQVYINTWHSGSILKKIGYDINNTPLEERVPSSNVKLWDWYVAGSKEKSIVFNNSTGYKGKSIVLGMPRIDYLLNFKTSDIEKIKKELNIPLNKKVILYAPTFRDNDIKGIRTKKILDEMFVPNGFILLAKMHPLVSNIEIKNSNVINVSLYNNINSLFIISDLLISDYSSVIFDYANLKRPIILYAYDLVEYKQGRDFYIDYENSMPGPIVKTNTELIRELKNIDNIKSKYNEKFTNFYDRFCSINDGKATKRFVDLFKQGYFRNVEKEGD